MKTEKEIRKDLKEIRFYYVNYDMFRKARKRCRRKQSGLSCKQI